MKIFFVAAIFLALLANVYCFDDVDVNFVTSNDILSEAMIQAKIMQKTNENPEFKNEIDELIKQIEIVEALSEFESVSTDLKRQKRQVTSFNCSTLPIQLASTQQQIATTQVRITNNTINLNTLTKQVDILKIRVETSTGSSKTSAQNLLTLYLTLVAKSNSSLETLKKQLADLQASETQIKNDIQVYCILTTTTIRPAVSSPCGTFVKFDLKNDRNGPIIDGFASGANSTTFVAFGNGSSCSNQFQAPCRLSTASGCRIPCGSSEIIDTTSVFYLQKNSNLVWVPTTSATMLNIPNSLKLVGPNNFMFGRALINGSYVLGKVQAGNGIFAYQAVTSSGFVQLTNNFEVLTCFKSCPCLSESTSTLAPVLGEMKIVAPDGSYLSYNGDVTLYNSTGAIIYQAGIYAPYTHCSVYDNKMHFLDFNGTEVWPKSSNVSVQIKNGEFVIVNGTRIIWGSVSGQTDLEYNPIKEESVIKAPDGSSVTFGDDLVIKDNAGNVIWSAGITGGEKYFTSLTNGSHTVLDSNGTVIWSADMGPSYAVIDGQTVIKNGSVIIWSSKSGVQTNFSTSTTSTFASSTVSTTTNLTSSTTSTILTLEPSTTSTTSTLASTTTKLSFDPRTYPCGSFLKYDTVLAVNDPENFGVLSGVNFDNTNEYVGYGNNNKCQQNPCSGFISTNATNYGNFGAGAYLSCGQGISIDKTTAYYLLASDNLLWVPTDNAKLLTLTNAIKIGTTQTFVFGRTMYQGQYRLGKVHFDQYGNLYIQDGSNSEIIFSNNYEILTCIPPTTTTSTTSTLAPSTTSTTSTLEPSTTSTTSTLATTTTKLSFDPRTYPCGSFLKYDTVLAVNDPANFGVLSGVNFDNTNEYVGYGNNNKCQQNPCSGFISTNATNYGNFGAGAYLSCGQGISIDKTTAYYLLASDNLLWVPTDNTKLLTMTNAIKIGTTQTFVFGRAMYQGQYRLGKVHYDQYGNLYIQDGSNSEIIFSNNYEILTCIPPTTTTSTLAPSTTSTTSTLAPSPTSTTSTLAPSTTSTTSTLEPSTTSTTSTLATTTTKLSFDPRTYPCGSFLKYDTVLAVNDPANFGVLSGVNFDNTNEYVGYGNNNKCQQNPCSGFISTNATNYGNFGAGAYLSCGQGISIDKTTAYYLLASDNLLWVPTDNTKLLTMTNAIKIGTTQTFVFGRAMYQGQYRLGKVHYDQYGNLYIQDGSNSEIIFSNNYEILTCIPLTTTTSTTSTLEPSTTSTTSTLEPSTTSTTSTTSLTTTQSTTNSYKCGDLIPFVGNDVTQLGFNSGTFYDGSTIYVGTSSFPQCWWQYESPARISTANSFKGPGGYMTCHNFVENYDNKTAKFFAKTDGLIWVSTNGSSYEKVPNGLKVGSMYVGRINITMTNGTFQQIGKIWAGNIYYKQPDTGIEKIHSGEFEILACTQCKYTTLLDEPCCTNGGRGKYCCENGANNADCCLNNGVGEFCCLNGANSKGCILNQCGFLIPLNGNDPALNGFEVGNYLDGSTIYAGVGNFNMCWGQNPGPARIMTTNSVSGRGGYCSCGGAQPAGENYDGASSQYFLDHKDLKWVPTIAPEASKVIGAVKVGNLYLGRKFLASANGTYVQVGKIENGYFRYKIPGKKDEVTSSGYIEVLACVPCTNGGSGPFCCLNGANNKECLLEPPCGTTQPFPQYNPNVDGFLSGTYQDGSKVFPGTADFNDCWSERNGPGRILTEFVNNKEPGGYQICGGAPERLDINDPQYFYNHPNMAWVQTNGSESAKVPGVIKTAGGKQHLVGRFNYITPNGTFQTIGKVFGGNIYFYQPGENSETITAGTFEVLTCQDRPVNIQCGTLLQFTTNNITEFGFNSGTFYDNSIVYPGTGAFSQCWSQNPSPARLTTASSFKGPGAYMTCYSNVENYDEIDPRFFAKHDNLRWVMTNGSQYEKVEGALKVGYLYVGRIDITMANGTYQQIGKIYNGDLYYKQPDTGVERSTKGPFEVLACTSCSYQKPADEPCCTNGGRGKFCCKNGANNADCCLNNGVGEFCCLNGANSKGCILNQCGFLIPLNGNDPALNGFEVGNYLDGSTIYAGVGNFNMCWGQNPGPARIMTTNSVSGRGGYCSCGGAQPAGENYDGASSQYFLDHKDLKWVPTIAPEASKVIGAVKVGNLYLGRKFLASANGTYVQVGKIENGYFRYKIPGKKDEVTSSGYIEVLACVPCTNGGSGPFCCLNGANNKECLLEPPCGTTQPFPQYNPNVDGFLSGTYQDGSKVFPGTADFNDCWSERNGPGRILTEFVNNKEPGGYQICGGAPERLDINDPQYFYNHPNMAWVQTNGSESAKVPGVIKTAGGKQHLVGRFNYITPNGTFQTIGKVYGENLYFYQPGDNSETKTAGTFEVLTCQDRPVNIQCGTLLQFTTNNITEFGFNSGTFYDNSIVYPGTGAFSQCWSQNPSPARLTTASSFKGPGAYMTCYSNVENYDEIDPRFFAKHDNLRWVMTNGSQYEKVEGALKVGYLYVGRIDITMANGTYQQIGKIYNGDLYYKQPDTGVERSTKGPFEVLACTSCSYQKPADEPCCTNGGRGKFCCKNGANNADCCLNNGVGEFCCLNGANSKGCILNQCGFLIPLNGNDPALNGFEAGNYLDGSTIYAGVGNFSMCWGQNPGPARIMTTNSVSGRGGYCSCGGAQPAGENYDGASSQYFLNHKDLKWVSTTADKASSVVGAIKVGNLHLGRKFLASTNGTYVQLGKIEGGYFRYKIPGKTNEFSVQGDIDVLACVPCTNGGSGPFCCLNGANNKECLTEFSCGATKPFPRNNPNVDGFLSGTYQDGSKVFPGISDFNDCWSERDGPGRILTEFVNNKEPGGYQICGGAPERWDYSNPQYFVKHPNMAWVQTTGPESATVPGVIKTAGGKQHLVGRFNYITPNGTFQTIGKVYGGNLYFYQPGDNSETITDGAFEVLTCQAREPVLQCGTLLQFTVNNITELGFPSGTFTDGSTVYAGTGAFGQCWSQDPSPARLTISGNFKGPGAYMTCGNNVENYDEIDPRFFAKHDNLTWVMTNGSQYDKIEGALKVGNLYVGRINITMANGTYQQIGKILNGNIYYKQPATGIEIVSNGQFEVLACTPCSYAKLPDEPCCTTGRGKYCCENGANNPDCCLNNGKGKFCCLNGADNEGCILDQCGFLVNLNGNNPTLNGFEAGNYIDGSKIYAGVGNFSMCWGQNPGPARIMTTNSVSGRGGYCSCGGAQPAGENYDGASSQYFANHPDLKWVPTTADIAANVVGAIKVGNLHLGRKFLASTNGTYVQVGKIEGGYFRYKIPGKTNEFSIQGDIDVLACVKCTNGGSGPFCCLNGANNKECLTELPCGSLAVYPKNDPAIDGFYSGNYFDGSKVYPGTGDFNSCWGQTDGAARIQTEFAGGREPGAYQTCGNPTETYDYSEPRYFIKHANLVWIPTTSVDAINVKGVIKVGKGHMVGRANYTLSNGTFTTIGKLEGTTLWSFQQGNGGQQGANGAIEILACMQCTNGGSGPYCCTNGVTTSQFCCQNGATNQFCCQNGATNQFCCLNGAQNVDCALSLPCGSLLPFNGTYKPDDPKNPGFESGVWADGGKIYPGSGNFASCSGLNPGVATVRLSSSLGAGAYQSFNFKPQCFDNMNAQYVLRSSNLAWKPSTSLMTAGIMNGVIVGGNKVGRINVTAANGTVYQSIGRIILGSLYYYREGDAKESTALSYDVLVCN